MESSNGQIDPLILKELQKSNEACAVKEHRNNQILRQKNLVQNKLQS